MGLGHLVQCQLVQWTIRPMTVSPMGQLVQWTIGPMGQMAQWDNWSNGTISPMDIWSNGTISPILKYYLHNFEKPKTEDLSILCS
jgi:hypothetical protein